MNTVEKIKQLPSATVAMNETFQKLSHALNEYHRLVQEGKLIPRKNNVQNIYTVCFSNDSNV